MTAAAAGAKLCPTPTSGSRSPTPPGDGPYPISSFTWLLVHQEEPDRVKGKALRGFLIWMLEPEAQRMAADLHYAPLPVPVIELLQQRLGPRAGSAVTDPLHMP